MTPPAGQPAPRRTGMVVAVHRSPGHTFSKHPEPSVRLVAGLGVEGDAHAGATVRHRSRVRRDPGAPNLRQVHLLAAELLEELRSAGHEVHSGNVGENVTTSGVDLLALPAGTRLGLGSEAVVELTGLRNPCVQLDRFSAGLMGALLDRDGAGGVIRRAGVMSVVVRGGQVRPGDAVHVVLPPGPHVPLRPV